MPKSKTPRGKSRKGGATPSKPAAPTEKTTSRGGPPAEAKPRPPRRLPGRKG
ncbi:hypothetical protein [Pseudoroseicyclus tamaricis]|uniref:Uncharacterized protein n=1 Tax=Pseudoroseicyclus tamaricis TaxID=2705421 RepID=A0A6B2JK74_9RHOB|nr:hypothetical protein [Pseudoroseicyclus tamaricis]NDV01871.1 hypothetical protein [Pseudoroseicyclus tamaricis]